MKPLKVLKWLAIGSALYFAVSYGFDFVGSYLKAKAIAAARAEFEQKLREADEKIAAGKAEYDALAEKAGREQTTLRLSAEDALRKAAYNFEKYKSRSAEELREKKAEVAEVLAEKRKDELAIEEAKGTINYLGTLVIATVTAWSISDENKDRAHEGIVLALEEKFSACDRWRKTIEKELRPTFWKRAKEAGKLALAFSAGYVAGRR